MVFFILKKMCSTNERPVLGRVLASDWLVVKSDLIVPLNPKMDRGSTGSGLTTAKRGKKQQAGNFRRLEPTTQVMGTCNSKP